MSEDLRMLQAGAVFSERCDSLQDLRNRGTVTSLPTVGSAGFGRYISFDGTDDKWATAAHQCTVKTVLFWAYAATTSEQFIDLDGGTHYVHASTGTVTATGFTAPTVYVNGSAASTITAATWNHIAVTTATGFTASNIQFATDNVNFGQVRLSDVLLFDRVLSAAEILSIVEGDVWEYDRDLAHYWDCSDANTVDRGLVGGSHMTGSGLVAATDILADGPCGLCTEYDGTEYHARTTAGWRSTDSAGTIIAVAKRASTGVLCALFSSNDYATTNNRLLWYISGLDVLALYLVVDGGTANDITCGTSTDLGRWHHAALTSSGTAYAMYLDAVAQALTVNTGADNGDWLADINDRDNVIIGGEEYNGGAAHNYMNGRIGGVWYYTATLNNLQIADHQARVQGGRL